MPAVARFSGSFFLSEQKKPEMSELLEELLY